MILNMQRKTQKINELIAENKTLLNRIRSLEYALTKLHDSDVMIDFDTMRVFSIERCGDASNIKTIIGYYVNNPIVSKDGKTVVDRDEVKEWSLYCSEEQHAKLIQDFKNWKTSNTKLV